MGIDMKIVSEWAIDYLAPGGRPTPSITLTGKVDDTTITVDGGGLVSIEVSDNSHCVGVRVDLAYKAIESMAQDVDTVVSVWNSEMVIAEALMAMVDINPIGYGDGEWELECNEEGLSWHLYLKPHDHASIVVSIYLYACIGSSDADGRVMPKVYSSIAIEVIDGGKIVATLWSMPIYKKEVITMDMVREYLREDPLNLSLLCSHLGVNIKHTN